MTDGVEGVDEPRLKTILEFALKANTDAKSVTDADTDALRDVGLSDKGIVQLVHLVSDFAAYNRLNITLDTDYDYRDMWRSLAFGWEQERGLAAWQQHAGDSSMNASNSMDRHYMKRFEQRTLLACGGVLILSLLPLAVYADWTEWLDVFKEKATTPEVVQQLTQSEIGDGLREALAQGAGNAVKRLGQPGGFLDNANVRIPMPKHLSMVESGLRTIGKDAIADQFVESMNHAAERAAPEAASVFADAISQMTVDDAEAILDGSGTAANRVPQTNKRRHTARPLHAAR